MSKKQNDELSLTTIMGKPIADVICEVSVRNGCPFLEPVQIKFQDGSYLVFETDEDCVWVDGCVAGGTGNAFPDDWLWDIIHRIEIDEGP